MSSDLYVGVARTNSHMLKLLGGDPEFHEPNCEPVPESLVNNLGEGFKVVDGCVVPASFQPAFIWSEQRPKTNNIDDETAFECHLSQVYLQDHVDTPVPLAELTRIGCAYAICLRKSILESQVFGSFRIIVDAQLPNPGQHPGNAACSVRFYKVRPYQCWLLDDLDSYENNALWVFEFEKKPHAG